MGYFCSYGRVQKLVWSLLNNFYSLTFNLNLFLGSFLYYKLTELYHTSFHRVSSELECNSYYSGYLVGNDVTVKENVSN